MRLEVGKAYRSQYDGLVRWITHRSSRGYFQMLWLDEQNGVWHSGGKTKNSEDPYVFGAEVSAPQSGDTYLMNVMGTSSVRIRS